MKTSAVGSADGVRAFGTSSRSAGTMAVAPKRLLGRGAAPMRCAAVSVCAMRMPVRGMAVKAAVAGARALRMM